MPIHLIVQPQCFQRVLFIYLDQILVEGKAGDVFAWLWAMVDGLEQLVVHKEVQVFFLTVEPVHTVSWS